MSRFPAARGFLAAALLVVWPIPQSLQAQLPPPPPPLNSVQNQAAESEDPAKSVKALLAPSIAFLIVSKDQLAKDTPGPSLITTALVIREDGLLVTSYDLVRMAKFAQVRLASGDIFNRVEMVSYDEARDLAVLKINAGNLTPAKFVPPAGPPAGGKVWVLSSLWGNDVRALACTFKDVVPAETATNGGKGFSLFEISSTDWLAPGQIAVDSDGRVLGIIIDSMFRYRNFASPVADVPDLLAKGSGKVLGSGAALRAPTERPEQTEQSSTLSPASLGEIARKARTVRLDSNNSLMPTEPVARKLVQNPDFSAWGLVIVNGDPNADLVINLDRPVLTWDFTFTITDRRTQAVLGSGKVIAWDGVRAAPGLADEILKRLRAYHSQPQKVESSDASKN